MTHRYRITYKKTEPMRYTGNLDVHKAWERTFRRAKLPLAYSQGFHPQPKIQLACPLPLGFLSENEILDFYTTIEISISEINGLLKGKLPDGLVILEIEKVLDNEPSLPVQTMATRYRIEFLDDIDFQTVEKELNNLLNQDSIIRKRRGKEYDLRPLIFESSINKEDHVPVLILKLSALQSATGRPDEVLSALNFNPSSARIIREKTYLRTDKK